jgi:hypothetical protein
MRKRFSVGEIRLMHLRGSRRVAVVLVSASAVFGGGVAATTSGAASRSGVARQASKGPYAPPPTTASNRRIAINDASQLLAGVVAPGGAVRQSSGTGIGAHAPLVTEALASAIAYSSWTVPDDPSSVLSFVEAHLPPGSSVVSTGSGGPNPMSQSVIRSWPPIQGVLDVRWLEIEVTSTAGGGTLLYAESQSQWVVTRPVSEQIPPGVGEVDVTSAWPGKPPFVSRSVTGAAKVRALVTLFDSLGIGQPDVISCPSYVPRPGVVVAFRARGSGRLLARAHVSSVARFRWPADVPGWGCFPISFNVRGRNRPELVGNVITPIEGLLHIKLGRHG